MKSVKSNLYLSVLCSAYLIPNYPVMTLLLALVLDKLKAVGTVSTVKHQHFTNLERDLMMMFIPVMQMTLKEESRMLSSYYLK